MKKILSLSLGGLCKAGVIVFLFFIYIAIVALANLSNENSGELVRGIILNFVIFIIIFIIAEVIYGKLIKRSISNFVNNTIKDKEIKDKKDGGDAKQ